MTIKGTAVALLRAVLCSCALLVLTSLQGAWAQDPVACTKAGVGPQSPRDLTKIDPGTNPVTFAKAPSADKMRLCNVHFHQFAEHKGKGYSSEAGKGDNKGFACNQGPAKAAGQGTACKPKNGHGTARSVGDTIEVHWVFTSCDVKPGPGLGGCASCPNAQLRVEARVFYLTDDATGATFADAAGNVALPAVSDTVEYLGSTTGGDKYAKSGNCSPLPVTWNVTQACSPLKLSSVGDWCAKDNAFKEDHAHGVRPLVRDAKLLSAVK